MLTLENRRWLRALKAAAAAVTACATLGAYAPDAEACGCTSPPVPQVDEVSFAVNQQSEQILFEVEPGFVTAHVLIRYAGEPSKFAWIVPVPSLPELDLTESLVFGLLEAQTAPEVFVSQTNACPAPEYVCEVHNMPSCVDPQAGNSSSGQGPTGTSGAGGGNSAAPGETPGGVEVIQKEQIGSYETIVFAAGDAQAAVDWLNAEGFIVNDTMTPYMQPYLDMNMLFVAAKLIPGAGAEEIKPLKMRFAAPMPMIPLQLTAVAAEPNLTVTAYIFGDTAFVPDGHPLVEIDTKDISRDSIGRTNYPMVLAREIDDVGRDGFIAEYSGPVPSAPFQDEPCCDEFDSCFASFDGLCQCPNQAWDADDCGDEAEPLLDAVATLEDLQARYTHVTRLTTRLNPEEMTFDPAFVPTSAPPIVGRLRLQSSVPTLQGCEADIIDDEAYASINERQDCAAVYCGSGECVATSEGAGCICDAGFVARTFTDLDGASSVTCVPQIGTVDLGANGLPLPSACDTTNVSNGACVDVGGFPAAACDAGHAAVSALEAQIPTCLSVVRSTGTRGAADFSAGIDAIAVCAPNPGTCGQWGWLVPNTNKDRQGVVCASSIPAAEHTVPGPAPTCQDLGMIDPIVADNLGNRDNASCGCAAPGGDDGDPLALFLASSLLGLAVVRRRRR